MDLMPHNYRKIQRFVMTPTKVGGGQKISEVVCSHF